MKLEKWNVPMKAAAIVALALALSTLSACSFHGELLKPLNESKYAPEKPAPASVHEVTTTTKEVTTK